jgi:hypothetical protein
MQETHHWFDMKSSGTVVYTTELQAKCVRMGWHMGTQQIINFRYAACVGGPKTLKNYIFKSFLMSKS